jgi:hypothetical protein
MAFAYSVMVENESGLVKKQLAPNSYAVLQSLIKVDVVMIMIGI